MLNFLDILLPDPTSFFIQNKKDRSFLIPITGYKSITTSFEGRTVVRNQQVTREHDITVKYDINFPDSSEKYLSDILSDGGTLAGSYATRSCIVLINGFQFEAFISGIPLLTTYERKFNENYKISNLVVYIIIDRNFVPIKNNDELDHCDISVKSILSRFELMEIE